MLRLKKVIKKGSFVIVLRILISINFGLVFVCRLFTPLSGYFTIESTSGRIVSAVSNIDYEEYTAFNITVMATDNGSPPRSIRKTVRVQVTDVNHPPTDLTFNERSVCSFFTLYCAQVSTL